MHRSSDGDPTSVGVGADLDSLVVVGATGNLGARVLELASAYGMRVAGLAVGSNLELASRQILVHRPDIVWVPERGAENLLAGLEEGAGTRFLSGAGQFRSLAMVDAQTLVVCIPSLDALELIQRWLASGRRAVVASKEILVAAGFLLTAAGPGRLIPLDSELTALAWLWEKTGGKVRRVVLPASGGPFRDSDGAALSSVTPAQALNHPVWRMGPKVTVDSATLVNKAFELIAAHQLFGIAPDRLGAVIHRQSRVHAMVLDETGAWLWHAGATSMDWAIDYALIGHSDQAFLELSGLELGFHAVPEPFTRALHLAWSVMGEGGCLPACFVGADDIAVEAFLSGRLTLPGIWALLEDVLGECAKTSAPRDPLDPGSVLAAVEKGRSVARFLLSTHLSSR